MTAPQHPPTHRSIFDILSGDKRSPSCIQLRGSILPIRPHAPTDEIKVLCEPADVKKPAVASTDSLEKSIPPLAHKTEAASEDNATASDPSPPSASSTKDSVDPTSDPPLPPDPPILHPLELAPPASPSTAILTTEIFFTTPSTRANSPSASIGGGGGGGGRHDDATTFFDDMMNDPRESGTLGLMSKGGPLTPSPTTSLPELYHDFFDNHPELCCESDQSSSDVEMMEHDLLDDEDAPVMIRALAMAEVRQATVMTVV
ncbi:hypothetical protein BGZ70_008566 [Mortierella alpina]|uniref:Uncharacterized protein n=1 Tax=Mortierella alpina TaxID=64518 RepID=A0A9P6J3M0_MORAP|nr:hypothetical protein BGZ70_008566 [Mortierella alpina]